MTAEQNNKIMVTDVDLKEFIIPSCKVISIDKRNANSLFVDIPYNEVAKYVIIDNQPGYNLHGGNQI